MVATVQQLAALVRGRVVGDGSITIHSARPVDEAGPGDITFIDDERYAKRLRGSPASAALVGPHFAMKGPKNLRVDAPSPALAPEPSDVVGTPSLPIIEVQDPRAAFVAVRAHLLGGGRTRWTGIDDRAHVSPTATIGTGVAIYPFAYIGEGAVVGEGSTIHPGAVVGADCRLGRDVILHPNVVLYEGVVLGDRVEVHAGTILGGDGFGYRQIEGKHVKVPHTGAVVVGDDVEIGSNCTVDRGMFESTSIGAGTKIDNLVMIGHNNKIGQHNLLCGQVGIAGSCRTGDYVVMAGQAGIKDHTEIGEKAVVGAQAGVHRNVPAGQQILGSPAIPIREQRRIFQMIARLPEMHRQLRELSAQVTILMAAGPDHHDETSDPTGF